MQYSEGKPGRIFVLRIDHGEDVIQTVLRLVGMKEISSAIVHLLGALSNGQIVTGPEEPVLPPQPHFLHFDGGWEVFGIGTVYPGKDGPAVHFHVSVGKGDQAHTGCLRNVAATYIVVEAVILEIADLQAKRVHDSRTGTILPVLGHREL